MSETIQTEEMASAAREFTAAAREPTAAVDRLSGVLQHPERGHVPGEVLRHAVGSRGLPEEEARELAARLVRRARKEVGVHREPDAPAPSPEEVRARREARRRREASRSEPSARRRGRDGALDSVDRMGRKAVDEYGEDCGTHAYPLPERDRRSQEVRASGA